MTNKTELTEKQVRKIAREEALLVQKDILKEFEDVKVCLGRLERLLIGELGTDAEDTLKARATFAYQYAKKNVEAHIIERAVPALDWFEDMNTPEKGCAESKLDTLGRIILAWSSMKWLGGLVGVVSVSTLIGLVILIINFLRLIQELSL